VLGVSCGDYRQHGAFADFVAVPQRVLYRLPDAVPFEQAAMVEALSVAVHAVGRATPKAGERALVVGTGMIGMLVIQVLRARGCGMIIAVDRDPGRLEAAKRHGATHTLVVGADSLVPQVQQLAGNGGVALAFEVVGAAQPLQLAVESVRKGGRVVLVGNLSQRAELPLQAVVTRELTLFGTCSSNGEYPESLELIASGKVDVRSLISATAPLAEGAQWFERLHRAEPGLMKVVLVP
jgi:L-iditol 2-dehydrogenase